MKRVVVTGMGVLAPLGDEIGSFWKNLVEGKSGATPITRFPAGKFRTRFACQLEHYQPEKVLDRNEIRRSDLYTQYALIAGAQAIEDSGFDLGSLSPYEVGVIWGSGQGGLQTFEEQVKEYVQGGYEPRFSPFFATRLISNMAAATLSIKYGFMGINYTTVSACATSNTAIMDALNYIRLGKAKIIITGGSEAPIIESAIGGFGAMKALSARNDDPATASRPFDKDRDGFVMGEGAGALVLEEYEHARKRGAKIYAEVAGAAMTADAYHMTNPQPEGNGARHGMMLALKDAGLDSDAVDYINAHATSTPVGDISEARAIYSLFGERKNLYISATKSMTGHLLGAAGAVEAITCIKCINQGVVVPTINTREIDPEIPAGLQIVLKESINRKVRVAMSNSFGFGGHNAIVVFRELL